MLEQNKRILNVLIFMGLLFLTVTAYLSYFELVTKDQIITSAYNRRQREQEDNTLRGTVFDRGEVALAKSELQGKIQERIYPYGRLYSQIIGYHSVAYGNSLLEAAMNSQLLNLNPADPVVDLKERLSGEMRQGNNVYLTIDHQLQKHAAQLLGERNGAVVVLNPQTGEILAMVSKPDFDPNRQPLEEKWTDLVESESSPFLPRATQGLYVPGSTYKVAISAMAIEAGLAGQIYQDDGSIVIDGKTISNQNDHAYGSLDLTGALRVSSNVYFSQLGVQLGSVNLKKLAERTGFDQEIPFAIPLSNSRFAYEKMSEADQAAVGMGQGKILVTPLHMAMITAGIANDGVIMQPTLIRRVITPDGQVLQNPKPQPLFNLTTAEIARQVTEMMQTVVNSGTGRNARISGIQVAGKTGTAENELSAKGPDHEHAWFISFAPAEDPQIAVAVVMEYSGSTGGQLGAPIARELMKDWLTRENH